MAKPIALRKVAPVTIPPFKGNEPQLELEKKTLWSPPKGLDYLNRKNRVGEANNPELMNLLLDLGVMRSRKGTFQLGAAAAVPVMAIVNFTTGSGIGFLLRFLTTKIQQWDGAAWQDILSLTPAVKATGILTGVANFANNETVTIDGKVYTFQAVLTNVDGHVFIGPSLAATLANLKLAIDLDVGAGIYYAAATTLHPTVSGSTLTAGTLTVAAKVAGAAGNAITTTEALANGSWGAATLTGGLDPVSAGNYLTGTVLDFFTYTAFNNTLLLSNGVDGTYEYAPLTGLLQKITEAPAAKHLSTIGGRVVASAVNGQEYTTQWSVKNNSHDWTGIGSGSEDLLSTPGGLVDSVLGVWPITEDTSLMVRTNSIWQVNQTGDEEAPFRFNRLFANLGSRSRHSIDVVPGGLVMLGTDDIYLIDATKPAPMGTLIRPRIFATEDLTKAKGRYRSRLRQYWLTLGGDEVYVYSFDDGGWSRMKYPYNVRWLEESIPHYGGVTWGEMVGDWASHPETWASLVGDFRAAGFFMATDEALGNTIQESGASTADTYIAAGKAALGIEAQTREFDPSTPLEEVQVNEAHLEYESEEAQDIIFEWSSDGGTTWNAYSTKTLAITDTVEISKPEKQIERKKIMLRLRSATLGGLTLVSFSPFLIVGAMRKP